MSDNKLVTILGGGNGAFAAAADLTQKGYRVNLCDPFREGENIRPIMEDRCVNFVGIWGTGQVALNLVTPQIEQALEGSGFVMVICPCTAHAAVAGWLAPYLQEGTTVLLNPGHTGGALNFRQALRRAGFTRPIVLGETNTLTYVARKSDSRTVNVSNYNKNVYVAALPASKTARLLEKASRLYPDLQPQKSVIGTSMRNLNAMMHPPGMILGAAWIESTGGNFNFYYDAATPAVGDLMQVIDDERLAISTAWGESLEPLIDQLWIQGLTTQEARQTGSLQEAFLQSKPNRWLKAPSSLDHRYMHEDIGNGLVPMVALGRVAGMGAPLMESIVNIACVIGRRDYWQDGLNARNLGLDGLTREQVIAFLEKEA